MEVKDHFAYQTARKLSRLIWELSRHWDKTTLHTLGNQLIRSTDSISANLAEGWSRYSKKDKINFFIIARGSLSETCDWIEKARERNLVNQEEYYSLQALLIDLPRDINGLIKGTNQNLQK